ncbi:hypothetical protein [Colwellia echini]|uniref:Uncharacterized protein n=1 Tax=Colwellia echini TaxID=1982103 RepID=A0ABY3MUH7_9GAMM|nr:hypothetical protein [Colwellia echini]TYK64865.1 hypothetical protein CWS31_013705 [Colwellia echini]
MDAIRNKDVLLIWPISLIGLPILAILLISIFGFSGTIYSGKLTYIFSVSGTLVLVIFGLFNVLFSFYTLNTFWSTLKIKERIIYSLVGILANVLSSYVLASLWKTKSINIYSTKGKKKHDHVAFVFYFFILVALLIPIFIANKQFK